MRERLERILGRTARAIWILTFHAACGRILRREAERLGLPLVVHDLRPGRPGAGRQGVPRGARQGPEALHAARDPRADLEREEPARLARRVHVTGRLVLGPDGRRGVRALPAQAPRLERRRLRRHADAHRRRARALPRGARALAGRLPPRPRRRVPGHEQRPVPPPAAARGEAPERVRGRATRTSRSMPSAAPTSATSSTSRRTSAGRTRSRSSRTTARRTRSSRRRTRSSTTTATASRSGSGRSSATATPSRSSRSRTSTPRRASSRPRSRASSSPGTRPPRSPSSTARTRSRASSRTCSSARVFRTR